MKIAFSFSGWAIPFFVLLSGLLLFCLAVPRIGAALNHIPVDTAIDLLRQQQPLPSRQLSALSAIAQKTLDFHDEAKYQEDAGRLFFARAVEEGVSSVAGREFLDQAKQHTKLSLSRSPANSYMWYRLAVIEMLLQAAPEHIANILRLSIMTGPHEPGFMYDRLKTSFPVFSLIDDEDKDLLKSQVLLAWEASNKDFLNIILNRKNSRDILTQLLEKNDPLVLMKMVLAYEKGS